MDVLAELGYVASPIVRRRGAEPFFFKRAVRQVLDKLRATVSPVATSKLDPELERSNGVVDAAIVALAQSLKAEGHTPSLLTIDTKLDLWCREHRIDSKRFDPAEAISR